MFQRFEVCVSMRCADKEASEVRTERLATAVVEVDRYHRSYTCLEVFGSSTSGYVEGCRQGECKSHPTTTKTRIITIRVLLFCPTLLA
ncbi:MAG: hypothetical protein GY788_20110 [bacterium]|nr:hypothetical protein [bacterium]